MMERRRKVMMREKTIGGTLIKGPRALNPDKGKREQGNKGESSDVHQKTPKIHHSPNSLTPIRRNPLSSFICLKGE